MSEKIIPLPMGIAALLILALSASGWVAAIAAFGAIIDTAAALIGP